MSRSSWMRAYWQGYRYLESSARGDYEWARRQYEAMERSRAGRDFLSGAARYLARIVPVPGNLWD